MFLQSYQYLQRLGKNLGLIDPSAEEKREERKKEAEQKKQERKQLRRERIVQYHFIFDMARNTIQDIQAIFDRIERYIPVGFKNPIRADTIFRYYEEFFLDNRDYNSVRISRSLHLYPNCKFWIHSYSIHF